MALIFPHQYQSPLQKCVVRIDDAWYDCTAWRHSHPGGAEIVDRFNNTDATDAFYSLHSAGAVKKLKAMKATKCAASDPPADSVSVNFQAFRQKLMRDGWFERNWAVDFFCYLLPCLTMVLLGSYLSYTYPLLATLLIGFGMQQAGWLGHDYVHGRGTASLFVGNALGGLINGFSSRWWSQKHNTHHTFPNRKEFDSDIHNEPILHLWFPDQSRDVWYRKYQHYYFLIAYSFLYVSWRMQSLQFVLGSRNWIERALIVINYIWLATLPWKVAIGSVFLGGFLVAVVVTANHQTEDIISSDAPYNFVKDQFSTTRGVHCPDVFTAYFFGGMQFQLEHHMFPTMPKANFARIRPLLKKFAAENELQYHISGIREIIRMNYEVVKKYAQ
jgi:fatty acid desaturase